MRISANLTKYDQRFIKSGQIYHCIRSNGDRLRLYTQILINFWTVYIQYSPSTPLSLLKHHHHTVQKSETVRDGAMFSFHIRPHPPPGMLWPTSCHIMSKFAGFIYQMFLYGLPSYSSAASKNWCPPPSPSSPPHLISPFPNINSPQPACTLFLLYPTLTLSI